MSGIPQHEWKWFGNAGHLCVSHRCRFHLCTKVGGYLVSTIGEYHPVEGHFATNDKGWEPIGGGDDAYFETMVFDVSAGGECSCGCGLPQPEKWAELDCRRCGTPGEANKQHFDICLRFARKEQH